MKSEPAEIGRDRRWTGLLKLGGLAVVLGVGTWALSNFLLGSRVPDDFPKLPDLRASSAGLRAALTEADREARKHAASGDAAGRLAMAYHANEYPAQAAGAYGIAARLAPGDFRWAYGRALLEEEKGSGKEQFRLLQQTARLKPDYLPALLKLGDGYFKQDQLDQAAHYYELAAKAAGKGLCLQAAFGLGRVAAQRQEWSKVVEYLAPLAVAYPAVRPPYQLLQKAYEALGQTAKAAEVRERLSTGTYTVLPPPEDAVNDQLIEVSYSSTRLLKQAGLLSRFGHPDRALQLARRAAEADTKDPDIRDFIARTLVTLYGDKPQAVDEALTRLAECLRLKPEDPAPLWAFTVAFFESGKTPAAVERLGALLRPYAGRDDAHFYLGLLADARGDAREAVAQYQAVLKADPKHSGALTKLGLILNQAGQLDGAAAYLQKAVRMDPMNTVARYNLGVTLMQRGNYGQGLSQLSEVLRLKPRDAATYFCMGFANLYSNRPDEAIAKFREGMKYKQDDAESHFGLGSALSARHRREEAAAELREALRLHPDYPEARDLLSRLEH